MKFADYLARTRHSTDEEAPFYRKIIGFRNALVRDYMNFSREIVVEIVRSKSYLTLAEILKADADYPAVIIRRIENLDYERSSG